jgi:hypothetical protein
MVNDMELKYIKQKLFPVIKVISIVVTTGAIALQLWDIQTFITNSQLPTILNPVLLVARFALTAHFIEGIIAGFYAPAKKQIPLKYGTYTFFVGTVGLLELWDNQDD